MAEQYNFDKSGQTRSYTVQVDTIAQYGYFEHNSLGDESAGGLWFEKTCDPEITTALELVDYDGVACLPKQVCSWLRENGFGVGRDFGE